jgi:hypothetical protein
MPASLQPSHCGNMMRVARASACRLPACLRLEPAADSTATGGEEGNATDTARTEVPAGT